MIKKQAKKKAVAKKAQPKAADKSAQRIIEIKARMFDLMAHRNSVNKNIEKELESLNNELRDIST